MFESLLQTKFSLERLRNFLAVVEVGSITKAAPNDRVRQGLICRQIGELEDFFGVDLTERRGKGIIISPAGKRLAMLVRESFQSFEDFKKEQTRESKQFAFGSGASGLEWLVLPCAHDLAEHLSNARVRVETHRSLSAVKAVRDGRLDFAIVREDAVPGGLPRADVGKVTFMLCVPKMLCRGGKADAVTQKAAWSALPLATMTKGGQFHAALQEAYERAGVTLQPAVECTSFLEVRELVVAGHYAGILPSLGVAGLESLGVVVRPFPPLKSYGRSLCLHWNARQMARRGLEQRDVNAIAATLRRSFKAAQQSKSL